MSKNRITISEKIDKMNNFIFIGIIIFVFCGLCGFWSLVYTWGLIGNLILLGLLIIGVVSIIYGIIQNKKN